MDDNEIVDYQGCSLRVLGEGMDLPGDLADVIRTLFLYAEKMKMEPIQTRTMKIGFYGGYDLILPDFSLNLRRHDFKLEVNQTDTLFGVVTRGTTPLEVTLPRFHAENAFHPLSDHYSVKVDCREKSLIATAKSSAPYDVIPFHVCEAFREMMHAQYGGRKSTMLLNLQDQKRKDSIEPSMFRITTKGNCCTGGTLLAEGGLEDGQLCVDFSTFLEDPRRMEHIQRYFEKR